MQMQPNSLFGFPNHPHYVTQSLDAKSERKQRVNEERCLQTARTKHLQMEREPEVALAGSAEEKCLELTFAPVVRGQRPVWPTVTMLGPDFRVHGDIDFHERPSVIQPVTEVLQTHSQSCQ
jgi:hypothetical protein